MLCLTWRKSLLFINGSQMVMGLLYFLLDIGH